jgi:hypothetical protein
LGNRSIIGEQSPLKGGGGSGPGGQIGGSVIIVVMATTPPSGKVWFSGLSDGHKTFDPQIVEGKFGLLHEIPDFRDEPTLLGILVPNHGTIWPT